MQDIENEAKKKYKIFITSMTFILFASLFFTAFVFIVAIKYLNPLVAMAITVLFWIAAIFVSDFCFKKMATKNTWEQFTPAAYKYNKAKATYSSGRNPDMYYISSENRDEVHLYVRDYSIYGHPVGLEIGTFKRQKVSFNDYADVVFDLDNMVCLNLE